MSRYSVLTSLKDPVLPRILHRLPEARTHLLFIFNALLEKSGKVSGPSFHSHLAALLQSAVNDEAGLQEWLQERFLDTPMRLGKAFEAARKQACRWIEEGRWAAAWEGAFPPPEGLQGARGCFSARGRFKPIRDGQRSSIQGSRRWSPLARNGFKPCARC